MKHKLIVIVIAAALLAGCTKEGSSGVQDGTRWNEADAVQMVSAAQDVSHGTLIRVDFAADAWRNDARLVQITSSDMGIKRNVVVDPAGSLIMVNYTLMCNFDGRGGGGKCVQEAQRPVVQGRWYRFEAQSPAIEARWLGGMQYEILMPAGWQCPICAQRGVKAMSD